MLGSITLTISGLIFITLISVVYFTKKKYNSLDNNIYRFLLILTIILLFLEIITVYTMSIRDRIPVLNEILCRIFILGDMIWFLAIVGYIKSLSTTKKYDHAIEFFFEGSMLFFTILGMILYPITCLLPMKFTSGPHNEFYVIGGKMVYPLYVVFGFVAIYMFIVLLKNMNKDNIIRRIPVFIFLIFYAIMGVIQLSYADLNDLTFLFTFCVISMYFTLENQDIKLVSELEIAKKEAEEADKAKTDFLSKMSHEIRTPMNVIMGFSEALLKNNTLNMSEVKNDVESINKAANSLLGIINNILDLSRIDSGKEQVEENEYCINDIVSELNSFVYSKIDKEKVNFVIESSGDIPKKLIGDKLKIYRVLSNILNNSVKYTSSGEIKLLINSDIKKNGVKLKFTISDTGQGIKKEDYGEIFNNFNDKSDDYLNKNSGAGLGLVVAKQLIDMMHGEIRFDSEYGIGTNFYITINQKTSSKELNEKIYIDNLKNASKKSTIFDCSKYKMMIVDDNNLNIKVINRLLEPYKINIVNCSSGKECIDRIKQGEKYDIIMLDHMMPELDGVATMKILRKIKEVKLPPIISMTANAVTGTQNKYLKAGFDDYIAKPIDIKSLNKLMTKYFRK